MARNKKSKTKICNKLAQNLIQEYFSDTSTLKKERESIKLFCQEISNDGEVVKKYLFRIVRYEVNNILVASVINSLSPEWQKYIYYKYKKNKGTTAISGTVNVSGAQLYKWEEQIAKKVYDASQFRLTISDVYYYKKIINVMEAIAIIITCAQDIDPAGNFIDSFWLNCLETYYNNYRGLLNKLEECIENQDGSMRNKVIATFVDNPFLSNDQLASLCLCNCGTVGRYKHEFEKSVSQYVCA
ncbi:hypothetical protein [Selenomonas ruminantium]|uniref:hypothetical protein n=1 Tax=Selenomonas ruminantium TaxID=971 RepID=UPI0026F02C5F|nr:hypothetical protein [Selenomonas ruminantium]